MWHLLRTWQRGLSARCKGYVKAALRRVFSRWVRSGGHIRLCHLRQRADNKTRVVVLSLGAFANSAEVARAANSLGYSVHVFCHEIPLEESRYADVWHKVHAAKDVTLACDVARRIGAVAVFSEAMNRILPLKVSLLESIGAAGPSRLAAETSTSKVRFRRSLDAAGLPNLAWDIVEPDMTLPAISLPVVLKPQEGTGSVGVRVVRNASAYAAAIQEIGALIAGHLVSGEILVEQYVQGRQFDVEGISCEGRAYVVCIVEEMYEASSPKFPPAWFLFNPPIDENLRERLQTLAIKTVAACGVRTGAWHVEIRVSADGRLFPIDYASRMGGYTRAIHAATEVDMPLEYIKAIITSSYAAPSRKRHSVVEYYLRTRSELIAARYLCRAVPEIVVHSKFHGFVYAETVYKGKILLRAAEFEALRDCLKKFDLMPETWCTFYDA